MMWHLCIKYYTNDFCSLVELRLTLWGGSAASFDHSGNPVLAIKGCKVSDYSGVSLSALSSSVIQINPDIAKCHELKGIPVMMIYTLFEKLWGLSNTCFTI